jgi:hypothetical protein
MRRLLVSTAVLATLATAAPAMANDTILASLTRATAVRSFGGTSVLSVYDAAINSYRLATQTGNQAPQVLAAIPASTAPFDADIGPGPGGSPVIVFTRCAAPGHCRIWRTTPAGGSARAVTGSAGTSGFESAPTVWGSRLAFARQYAHGSQVVYVRPLDAGRNVASTRLPGVPTRECTEVRPRCLPVTHGTVSELDLHATTLAENVHFPLNSVGICGEGQMRLVDVVAHTSRLVVHTICGLSGSTLVGASLTGPYLIYARTCPGDSSGCEDKAGILYRYRLSDRSVQQSPLSDDVTGIEALSANSVIQVRAPESHAGDCVNHLAGTQPPCQLVRSGPLTFGVVPAPGAFRS